MIFNKKTLFILSALSAILMILAFPMFNFYLSAFVAFVPMCIIIYSDITIKRFFLSFSVFVFIFFGVLLFWIAAFMLKATPVYVAVISLLFILVAESTFYAIAAIVSKFLIKKFPAMRWLIIPACFSILEYMRTVGFLGFPWGLIGYSQWKFIYFIQIADIVGVIGVGFVIYFVNAIIADMIVKYKYDRLSFNDIYLKFPNCFTNNFIIMIVVFMLIFAYGVYQINGRYYEYNVAMEKVKIGMVQKSFDPNHRSKAIYTGEPALQGAKGIRAFVESLILNPSIFTNEEPPDGISKNGTIVAARITRLAREAALHKPSLIVFSESAINNSYQYYEPFIKQNFSNMNDFKYTDSGIYNAYLVYQSVVATESYYLLGASLIHPNTNTNSKAKYEYFNGATFINTNGAVIGQYGKIKLVPFGEAYPFEDSKFFRTVPPFSYLVNFIYKHLDEASVGGWGKWDETTVFEHPRDGYKFAISICYESGFGDFTRRFVKKGADIIIVITDDAWSYKDIALWEHFSMAVFRAVENRKDVLQNGNSGITGHIDAYGHVVSTMEAWKPGYSIADVRINEVTSIYTRFGEWFVGVLAIFIVVLFMIIIILFITGKIKQFLLYIKQRLSSVKENRIKNKEQKIKNKLEQEENNKKDRENQEEKIDSNINDEKKEKEIDANILDVEEENIDDAIVLDTADSRQVVENIVDNSELSTLEKDDLDIDDIVENDNITSKEIKKNNIEKQSDDFNIDNVSLDIDEKLLAGDKDIIEEDVLELDTDDMDVEIQDEIEDEIEELDEIENTDIDLEDIVNEEINKQIKMEERDNEKRDNL